METFIEFDKDNSGTFDCFEIRDALQSVGIVLSRFYIIIYIYILIINLQFYLERRSKLL